MTTNLDAGQFADPSTKQPSIEGSSGLQSDLTGCLENEPQRSMEGKWLKPVMSSPLTVPTSA